MNIQVIKAYTVLNWKQILPYVIIVILGVIIYFYANRTSNLNDKLASEVKLRTALLDTVDTYRNSRNELVSEKLTLQASLRELQKINGQLSENQKELLQRVKELNKKSDVIAAALYETNVILDSIRKGKVTVDTTAKTITVKDSLPEIQYSFTIGKVIPAYKGVDPTFDINKLVLTNKTFVTFDWGKKKYGYPVSFSVTNTNKYFKTTKVDSYIIPEVVKPYVKPTFWQKLGTGFKKTGKYALAAGIGALTVFLIMK